MSGTVNALKSSPRTALAAFATLAILFAPLANSGQIYRCSGTDGSIEFSNLACPPDTAVSAFTVKANFVDTSDTRYRGRPGRAPDDSAGAAGPSYTGIGWDNSRRYQADLLRPINSARDFPIADTQLYGTYPSQAGRIREARGTDAQRRSQRAADWSDRKP